MVSLKESFLTLCDFCTGALAELLVMLDHEQDAWTLQAAHAEWVAAHQVRLKFSLKANFMLWCKPCQRK